MTIDNGKLVRTQGVTAPLGFRAAGIAAGIKKSGKPDLALVFNEGPEYAAAGVEDDAIGRQSGCGGKGHGISLRTLESGGLKCELRSLREPGAFPKESWLALLRKLSLRDLASRKQSRGLVSAALVRNRDTAWT